MPHPILTIITYVSAHRPRALPPTPAGADLLLPVDPAVPPPGGADRLLLDGAGAVGGRAALATSLVLLGLVLVGLVVRALSATRSRSGVGRRGRFGDMGRHLASARPTRSRRPRVQQVLGAITGLATGAAGTLVASSATPVAATSDSGSIGSDPTGVSGTPQLRLVDAPATLPQLDAPATLPQLDAPATLPQLDAPPIEPNDSGRPTSPPTAPLTSAPTSAGTAPSRGPAPAPTTVTRAGEASGPGAGREAATPGPATPAPLPSSTTDGDRGPVDGHRIHVVRSGEHFWSIASDRLADHLGRTPGDAEVVRYWLEVIDENRDRLVDPDDPDLIHPGLELVLPDPTPPG